MNKLIKTIAIVLLTMTATAQTAKFDRKENQELTDDQGENELDKPKDTPVDNVVILLVIGGFILGFIANQKNLLTNKQND
jgi:hypothetical protein